MSGPPATILIVDDNAEIRELLARGLLKHGHSIVFAENGRQALGRLGLDTFDLVLLDIMMPEMDGREVLKVMKADPDLHHVPVIVISAVGEMDSVVQCIEMGAEDYLPKPFNSVLLMARVGASLEKKRLRDRERQHLGQLKIEQEKSDRLLLSIFPPAIAERLKNGEREVIAEYFPAATILFADISDFSLFVARRSPEEVVKMLSDCFSAFDRLAEQHGVEKIKTISDTYVAAGGVPVSRADHAEAVAELALSMQGEVSRIGNARSGAFSLRIGIHSGPVVAGVIGTRRLAYDLWGETVTTAIQTQAYGLSGSIQVTAATHALLKDKYIFEERGTYYVVGTGEINTYLLQGRRARGR